MRTSSPSFLLRSAPIVAGLAALGFAQPTAAADCSCTGPGGEGWENGLVYHGDRALSLDEIVHVIAPVLWYSEDEPLIAQGDIPLPHAHPCDPGGPPKNTELGVVYWQPKRIQLRSGDHVTIPAHEDPDFWSKVEKFAVRFYFYYNRDMGAGQHQHDLEPTDFHVRLAEADGCYKLILERVVAMAHGTDWYSNELVVQPDTRYPFHLFVEEGKHASCPDRNADGVYTPGYDVNRRVQDAWGVRDVFGSGYIISSGFQASMTKQRSLPFRVFPPETDLLCVDDTNSSLREKQAEMWGLEISNLMLNRYELRPSQEISICEVDHADFLLYMQTSHKFGEPNPPQQFQFELIGDFKQPLTATGSFLSGISFRWDRGPGLAFNLRGADLQQVYLVPRINYTFEGDLSFEGMIIGSAAKFWDSYVSAGAAYERIRHRTQDGLETGTGHEWNFVVESGMKFRLRISGKKRILALGYEFAGVRLGVRGSGFNDINQIRMIFEIGAGVW